MRQQSQADKTDGFELDERPIVKLENYDARAHADDSGEFDAPVASSSQRSDSNETITRMGSLNGHGMGIMRTTEVVVTTA